MELKPGYKQTEVGTIPEDWELPRLDGHAAFRTGPFGSALHKADYTDDGVPVVNPMHIVDAHLVPTASMTVTEAAARTLAEFRLRAGDVVIGRRGDMGRCAVVRQDQAGWLCGTGSMIVRCRERLLPDFLQRVLSSARAIAAIEGSSVGTTMVNLNQGVLAALRIQCPGTDEQRAISEALGDVDALLGALTQLIAKKRDLKQAAMQQLLTGRARLQGFHGEWDVKQLHEIVLNGPKNGYSGQGAPEARGTPTLRLTATTSGYLILNDETVKRLDETIGPGSDLFLRHGDVLIQRSNTPDLVGTAALFDGPSDVYVYPDLMMRLRFREQPTARWIWNYANSQDGRRFFLSASAGSTGSMPKISGQTLRRMLVPFPPLAEQAAIAAVLADMDAEIASLERRLAKTRALKQGMMQELLTGRTRLV